MGVERDTSARERRLFEFLAASRPQWGWRGGMAATAASVVGHGATVGAVVLATVMSTQVASTAPRSTAEKLDIMELTTPSLNLGRRPDPVDPPAARAAGEVPVRTAPVSPHRVERKLVSLAPPMILPQNIPLPRLPVAPAPDLSEYDGIGLDTTLSAAAIFADHHERTAEELAAGPPSVEATRYTQAPTLINENEMRKLLSRKYPSALKDEGIGGRVLIWFLVDEFGHARRWLLKQSSGQKALDKAALSVASLMRFRPALNYDRPIAVWVILPVTFRVMDDS